jgi:hypothetical protein
MRIKVRYVDSRGVFWLTKYENGVPAWGKDRSEAVSVGRDAADELKERYGLRVSGGNLVFKEQPDRETERIKRLVGHDYWNHIT